jgi:hypothetical protein
VPEGLLTGHTSGPLTAPARIRPVSPSATMTQLVMAARLGARVAAGDSTGETERSRPAIAAWLQLRRQARAEVRPALQIAFDTGYGRGMNRRLALG